MAPAVMSGFGTFETCQLRRAMSEFEGKAENMYSYRVLLTLTRTGSAGISWTVGFRSSSCRKAAQKLKQRRVDFGRRLLLKPMAGILHQPDVAKVGALLTHQFDHIDAGYHAEDRFEAAS